VRARDALRAILALAAVTAAVAASPRCPGEPASPSRPLAVEVRPVPLNPAVPAQLAVGPLVYRGGLWLRSYDPRFGGLSDLRVSTDRERLVAVSDCGHGFSAVLRYDDGSRLVGLEEPRLVPLLGPHGRPLNADEVDAEGLCLDGDGLIVTFEGRHRLWRYAADPPFGGWPTPIAGPAELATLPSNSGIEAATRLGDGRLLLIAEGPTTARNLSTAWIGREQQWTRYTFPLFIGDDATAPYRPTSLALLPNGGLVVLERRFPPLAARLRRVAADALARGDFRGTEIARLAPPLTVDNMEGVDAGRGPKGETLLYLVSDDNNCAKRGTVAHTGLQRTLLLLFELTGPPPS
jgi:hypothetical protein